MSITTQTVDRIRVVSLNRPDRHNALDEATMAEIPRAIAEATVDQGVDVVLLRGEGRSFCSGADVATLDAGEFGAENAQSLNTFDYIRRHQDNRFAQLDCPKPVVAALKGHVIGGGMELALGTDIRIAATDVRMSLPELRYGISTDTGGSVLTTILAGPSRAKLLLLTGRKVDAATALAWGLVDLVVEPEALDEEALTLCRQIAETDRTAAQTGKLLVDQVWDGAVRRGIRSELFAQAALFTAQEKQG
jgi:enoyl-CoA hydratase/carnithine racemase